MKYVALFLLFSLALFVVSCGTGGSSGPDANQPRDQDFNKGTGFMEINFIKNAPPAEVFERTQSAAIIKLTNNGATDILQGYMVASADPSVIQLIDSNVASFSLEGKKADLPKGDEEIITFNFLAKPLPLESQVRQTRLVITSCYDYQTEVIEEVCVDADPYDLGSDLNEKVCDLATISPGGTGGPVVVSSIEPRFEQNGDLVVPVFLITVTHNSGSSDLIMDIGNALSYCSDRRIDEDATNFLRLRAELSDIPLACDRERIELINGKTQVTCRGLPIDTTYTGTYEAPLLVVLDYGIAQTKTKTFDVIRTS